MNRLLTSLLCLVIVMSGCRSSKHLAARGQTPSMGSSAETLSPAGAQKAAAECVARVAAVQAGKPCLTATAKVAISGKGKDLSASGQLRLKRDDVVRLSIRVLGMEVGLLEFTPSDVLIVDRFNKQYVRASYAEVPFLKQADLDFYALQALFWNEIFVPGQRKLDERARSRFSLSETEGRNLLSLTDTPRLRYDFFANSRTDCIEALRVEGRNASDRGTFSFTYADFRPFSGRSFPTRMQMRVTGAGTDLGLDLSLSGLKTDSDWNTRTTVSAKYTRRPLDQVLKALKL